MQECRLRKLPEEIAVMEEASAIAEAVTAAAADAVAPGVRENDVVAEALHTLYRLGGEMAHVATPFVASGEHMSPPNRLSSDKILRNGDVVFIDIGAMWGGYFSDVARTVVCGTPNDEQRRVYTTVHDALQAGIGGDDARQHQRRRRRCDRRGRPPRRPRRALHLAVHRARRRHRLQRAALHRGVAAGRRRPSCSSPGMTFAVEPLIWLPGVRGGGGVRLEDTILVEPHPPPPLTPTASHPPLLPDYAPPHPDLRPVRAAPRERRVSLG